MARGTPPGSAGSLGSDSASAQGPDEEQVLPAVAGDIHRPSAVVVVVVDSRQVPVAVVHSPVAADTDGSSAAAAVAVDQGIVVAVACQEQGAC